MTTLVKDPFKEEPPNIIIIETTKGELEIYKHYDKGYLNTLEDIKNSLKQNNIKFRRVYLFDERELPLLDSILSKEDELTLNFFRELEKRDKQILYRQEEDIEKSTKRESWGDLENDYLDESKRYIYFAPFTNRSEYDIRRELKFNGSIQIFLNTSDFSIQDQSLNFTFKCNQNTEARPFSLSLKEPLYIYVEDKVTYEILKGSHKNINVRLIKS